MGMDDLNDARARFKAAAKHGDDAKLKQLWSALPEDEDVSWSLVAATRGGHAVCVKMLLGRNCSQKAKLDAVKQSALNGRGDCLGILLEAFEDEEAAESALSLAAMSGHEDCVGLAMGKAQDGADRRLALNWAVECGHVGCAKMIAHGLMEQGVGLGDKAAATARRRKLFELADWFDGLERSRDEKMELARSLADRRTKPGR